MIELIKNINDANIVINKHNIKNIGLPSVLTLLYGGGFLSPTQPSTSLIPTIFLVFTPVAVF